MKFKLEIILVKMTSRDMIKNKGPIRSIFISFFQVFSRILSGLVLVKYISFFYGPSGLAFLGQCQNFLTIFMSIFNGISNVAIVNLTTRYKKFGIKKYSTYWTGCVWISILVYILTLIIILIFKSQIEDYFFHLDYKSLYIYGLIIILPFVIFSSILIPIVSVLYGIKLHTSLHVRSFIVYLLVAIILILLFDFYGILLTLLAYPIILSFLILNSLRYRRWFRINNFFGKIDFKVIKEILPYFFIFSFSNLTTPLISLTIRTNLINNLDSSDAGIWQAVMKISDSYMSAVTIFIFVYFIPRVKSNKLKIIFTFISLILFGQLIILTFDEILLSILFSNEFLSAGKYLKYQFLADLFKIFNLFIFYIMLSEKKYKWAFFSETLYASTYIILFFTLFNITPNLLNCWQSSILASLSTLLVSFIYIKKSGLK